MSLEVNVNIVKGWPSPTIVEKSMAAASGSLAQGDIVKPTASGWALIDGGTKTVANFATPFIIMVDSTDPSTNRGAFTADYKQVGYGAIHGIGLNNALEIETTNFANDGDLSGEYAAGVELTVGTSGAVGELKAASSSDVVIGKVSRAPYSLGTKTYVTFIPCDPYVKA